MHAPPKLNSLMLVGDNYQLNSFQPTMGYQGTNVNFLAGLIGVFELFAYFLILKLPPVTCKLKWRLILHVRLWLHISMFQLAGNLSGLPARLRRGRSRGSWQTGSRKQRGRRSGEGVRGDNGVPAPGRRPGEGVRGDNRVPPPHPIHIRRQKQGKAPPCVVIRSLRSYYVLNYIAHTSARPRICACKEKSRVRNGSLVCLTKSNCLQMSCVSFFGFVFKSLIGAKAICWPAFACGGRDNCIGLVKMYC